jgi:hypothetical protein
VFHKRKEHFGGKKENEIVMCYVECEVLICLDLIVFGEATWQGRFKSKNWLRRSYPV